MSAPRRDFALGRVLAAAGLLVAAQRRAVLHAITPPAIVLCGHALLEAVRPELAESLSVGVLVLMIPLQVLLAVNVQRLALLGAGVVPPFGVGPWGLREWRYLGWTWLQWLGGSLAFLVFAPLGAFGPPGWAVALVAGAWMAGRLALVLPGIAVDRSLEFREAWRLGQGVGLRLALLTVGVPMAAALVLFPLGAAELLPLRLAGSALSLVVTCWYTAALALAWRALLERRRAPPETPRGRAAPADLELVPDAVRGVLRIGVPRRFETPELGHLAALDGQLAYHGRIRGVVLEVDAHFTGEEDRADWHGLDALLSHLAVVRVHGEGAQRVALVAPAAWAPEVEDLRKHFGAAELRWFPPLRLARAMVWASGEDPA